MAYNVSQTGFRIRTDHTAAQGGSPVWAAAQNVSADIAAGIVFRIRFVLYNSGTTGTPLGYGFNLGVSENNGTYMAVSIAPAVSPVDATSGASANGSAITTSLLSGSGTFYNGGAGTGSGYSSSGSYGGAGINLPAGNYAEYEFGVKFNSPACNGNVYTFELLGLGGVSSWTQVPSFSFVAATAALAETEANDFLIGNAFATFLGVLTATEANDVLTGVASEPVTGVLAITEANDALTGAALLSASAALARTEANDVLTGAGLVIALGGIAANLAVTEANDALAGAASVTGVIGVLNAIEAGDSVAGLTNIPYAASLNTIEDSDILVSRTMLGVGQWLPVAACQSGVWRSIDGSPAPIIIVPPSHPIPPLTPIVINPPSPTPPSGGDVLRMEQLAVLGVNALSDFSFPPNMDLCTLTVDGRPFFPVGALPDFRVSGRAVTWLNTTYSVAPGSVVIASYTLNS